MKPAAPNYLPPRGICPPLLSSSTRPGTQLSSGQARLAARMVGPAGCRLEGYLASAEWQPLPPAGGLGEQAPGLGPVRWGWQGADRGRKPRGSSWFGGQGLHHLGGQGLWLCHWCFQSVSFNLVSWGRRCTCCSCSLWALLEPPAGRLAGQPGPAAVLPSSRPLFAQPASFFLLQGPESHALGASPSLPARSSSGSCRSGPHLRMEEPSWVSLSLVTSSAQSPGLPLPVSLCFLEKTSIARVVKIAP